jgi:phenylacetate-CoA ligase
MMPRRALPDAAAIAKNQRDGRQRAVAQAKRAPFYKGKLDHIALEKIDEPAVWQSIPVLDKEMLRAITDTEFYADFCLPVNDISEFWRSGGATGKPLFYPRNQADLHHAMIGFARLFDCLRLAPGTRIHDSFPLGIHPVGQMLARAAEISGLAVNWAGAGNTTPSQLQLELIKRLRPSVWMGMSSYALHLANLADSQGFDLASAGVKTVMCSAEPLSDAKRAKIARAWGAQVFDTFGMTEAGMMGCEDPQTPGQGFRVWSDLFYTEVLHPETYAPVPEGEVGVLVVTPLATHNVTPFLRWNSGDLVTARAPEPAGVANNPFAIFPLIKHAHRTVGFFKVRGINLNHTEFEDFMFSDPRLNDFKAEAISTEAGLDVLRVSVEVRRDADAEATVAQIAQHIKEKFELSAELVALPLGTLAREFESAIKAPRFADKRGG